MSPALHLHRIAAAMALRSLVGHLERRLDAAAVWVLAVATFGEEAPELRRRLGDLVERVSEVGARLSGVVAGCGCDTDDEMSCSGLGIDYCHCGCHNAAAYVRDLRTCVAYNLRRAREALARPVAPRTHTDGAPWGTYGAYDDGEPDPLCEACDQPIRSEADRVFCADDSLWFHRACIDEPAVTAPGGAS